MYTMCSIKTKAETETLTSGIQFWLGSSH